MGEPSDIQNALLQAIFLDPHAHSFNAAGLEVYRNNLRATANKALQITYPTVLQLIGDDLFFHAVEQLLKRSPPHAGDWGMWGEGFAQILSEQVPLQEYLFVVDCAHLDFQRHILERAANSSLNTQSLQLLATEDPDGINVIFNPSIRVLESRFPLADIWQAHQGDENERAQRLHRALQDSQSQFPSQPIQYVLLYRPLYKAQVRVLSASEYEWIEMLKHHSLGATLSQLESSSLTFENFLSSALQDNLISHLTNAYPK